ncbi:sulfotransferase family protein [Pseudomonas alkylphenolica]|uniref:Sulfotransferase family protein n=1 Tax=Pseudomonas alkylphenolica TaxID=237609 RepID=A0A443ZIS8_9PSED|nr:sulfotransferase [Pseudomonas alkylphenolica]RWU18829.1 sulfotransferase family protein [Pseudomonas alkylphenolica]
MTPDSIRITDLGAPELTERQRQAIASAPCIEMREEAVLAAACQSTGLSDFGADDFRERLRIWLKSFDEDAGLGPLGRAGMFGDAVRYAASRLRFEDLVKRYPQINDIEIQRPIIVAGLPRSGTTHLVNILAADPRLRSMPLWEAMEPIPVPQEQMPGGEDPRITRTRQAWGEFETLLPYMPAMHEMSPTHVHEDIELQGLDFSTYLPEWQSRPSRWRDYYYRHDQTPHYRYGRRVLQALTWLQGPNRWVMKSPPHMENLRPLMATYPDATLVITHRDPVAVLQSAITMIAYGDRIRRHTVDLKELANYWTDRVEHLLRACVRDRDSVPADQSLDVRFDDYMADQQSVIERIYTMAGLPLTADTNARIQAYLNANPRGKHGRVVYDLKGDFGVDIAALRERFGFYYERFSLRPERIEGERP